MILSCLKPLINRKHLNRLVSIRSWSKRAMSSLVNISTLSNELSECVQIFASNNSGSSSAKQNDFLTTILNLNKSATQGLADPSAFFKISETILKGGSYEPKNIIVGVLRAVGNLNSVPASRQSLLTFMKAIESSACVPHNYLDIKNNEDISLLTTCVEELLRVGISQTTTIDVNIRKTTPKNDKYKQNQKATQGDTENNNIKEYMKVVSKTFDLFPFLKTLHCDIQLLNLFVSQLVEREQWTGAVRIFNAYVNRFTPSDLSILLSKLLVVGEWERVADLLCVDHWIQMLQQQQQQQRPLERLGGQDEHSNSNSNNLLLSSIVHSCLNTLMSMSSDEGGRLVAALRVTNTYGMKTMSIDVARLIKNIKLKSFVKKGKWQLALQIAGSIRQKTVLYGLLIEEGLFEEAQMMYNDHNLGGLVTPVTAEQLAIQSTAGENNLQLPLSRDRVLVVNCLASLQTAISLLGLGLGDTGILSHQSPPLPLPPVFVGIDVEWRASMGREANKTPVGASLLQVALPSHVIIFDLHVLGNSGSGRSESGDRGGISGSSAVLDLTIQTLRTLFLSKDIIKVTWRFNRGDLSMLRAAAGGYSRNCDDWKSKYQSVAATIMTTTSTWVFREAFVDISGVLELGAVERAAATATATTALSSSKSNKKNKKGWQDRGLRMETMTGTEIVTAKVTKMVTEGYIGSGSKDEGSETAAAGDDGEGSRRSSSSPTPSVSSTSSPSSSPAVVQSKNNLVSLSSACSTYLGKSLSKRDQTSNWEARPLTESQVHYAALDSHCLLGLLAAMCYRHDAVANNKDNNIIDSAVISLRELYFQYSKRSSTPSKEGESTFPVTPGPALNWREFLLATGGDTEGKKV
eukprot:gene9946-20678_t